MSPKIIGMLLMVAFIIAQQLESVVVKRYASKHGDGGMFFNAAICFFAFICTCVTETMQKEYVMYFPKELWFFGIMSGIFFAMAFYTLFIALKTGPFGITMLLSSYYTIFSILYGIIFLKEPANYLTYIATVLIMVSLFLMNYQGKSEAKVKTKISPAWVISIILCIAANAGITILSKELVLIHGNKCSNEFLILSFGISTIALIILSFIYEREKMLSSLKSVTIYGFLGGIFNGSKNVFGVMTLVYLSLSFVSTVRTALSMTATFLISMLFYKEKFTKKQLISVLIGIAAIVILNIPV